MSRDSADDNQQLPPWLRGLPLPPRPPGSPAARSDALPAPGPDVLAAASSVGDDQMPSWLADLSAAVDASDAAPAASGSEETPSWLKDLGAAEATPAAPGGEEMPSWLADLSAAVDASDAAPAPSADEETPSWLAELSATADAAPAASAPESPSWLGSLTDTVDSTTDPAALPDWLRSAEREPPPQPSGQDIAPPSDAEEGLPDWLRGAGAPPTPPAAEGQPPWLTGLGDETPKPAMPASPPQSTAPDIMPDWLREPERPDSSVRPTEDADAPLLPDTNRADVAAPTSTGAGSPAASDDADDADIPSWLRDIPTDEIRRVMEADDEEEITLEPFSFDMAGDRPDASTSTEGPPWLSGINEASGGNADSGPAWLGDLSIEPSRPAGASEAPEVPLWLQDLGAAPASEPDAGLPPESVPEAPTPQDEMPAWLRDADSTQTPASGLPAWLQAEPSSAPPPATELPAWLKEEAPSATPAGDMPAWLQAEPPAAAPQAPPAEGVPAWLQAEPPAAAPQTPSAEGIPAWLQAEPPAAAPQTPPAEDIPAWLQAEPPAAAPQAPPAEDIPAWLQSASPAADAPAADVDAPPATTPPAWLSDALASALPAEAPKQPGPAPVDDLPAWLREDVLAPPAANDLPNWLNAGAPAEPPRVEPPPPAADDLPPWLRDEVGQPLPTAGTPGDANLPAWLRGATELPAEAERRRAEPPVAPTSPGAIGSDWFDETPGAAGRASAGESEFFGGAELPAWLRKAEVEPVAEINPTDARSLDWLTKLGAQEDESIAAIAAPSAKLPLPTTPTRTAPQLSAIALLEQLAADLYPEAAPLPAPPPQTLLQRIGLERMLYVVLLVVLLTALAVPSLAANLQSPPEAPGAAELFQRIDGLTDKDVVLIGYEWDARRISEMKPLEQAVIGQLIQKQVKLVLVSTDPQGSLLLFDLRDQLNSAGYGRGAEDYILLGYKPGGELALRSLVQDFQGALRNDFQGNDATIGALAGGSKTGKVLTSLGDLSMIVVLADDAGDVQSWFEQIRRSVPQLPLAFLLPAEAAPIVQPYLQASRDPQIAPIYHLAGKQGALAYEQLRGSGHTADVQVERETGQQRLGILVFVVLLLIGGIVVGVGGTLRRRTGA